MSGRSYLLLISVLTTASFCHGAAPKIFDSSAPLELELVAPFHLVVADRVGDSKYHPGELRYRDSSGVEADVEVVLPIEVRTRGKTRRGQEICAFPPLRLRIASEQSSGTLFSGQKTFKLVTHCRDRESYDQLVLQEYLAYRLYELFTEFSFRTRLVNVVYKQSNRNTLATRYGIVLEHWKSVGARTGAEPVETDGGIDLNSIRAADANRFAVFQFLIGNEDHTMLWPERNEDCCHNSKPLFKSGWVVPVPYDFDFSGIVDAPYAIPRAPNRDVRNRRYAGLCSTQSSVEETLQIFREKRESVYALYRNEPAISDRKRLSTLEYLDEFYAVIDDPTRVRSQLKKRCHPD